MNKEKEKQPEDFGDKLVDQTLIFIEVSDAEELPPEFNIEEQED